MSTFSIFSLTQIYVDLCLNFATLIKTQRMSTLSQVHECIRWNACNLDIEVQQNAER